MNDRYVEATETPNGVTVAKILANELRDADQCYAVRDQLIEAVTSLTHDRLIIDLSNVRFVGSVGLLAFLAIRRHLADGEIVICNLDVPIREMMVVCHLISTDSNRKSPFEVRDTLQDALAAFRA